MVIRFRFFSVLTFLSLLNNQYKLEELRDFCEGVNTAPSYFSKFILPTAAIKVKAWAEKYMSIMKINKGCQCVMLVTIFMFVHLLAKAQVAVYMLNDQELTMNADSAIFKRVVYNIDSATNSYPIVDYYLNGKIKSRASASSLKPFVFTGQRNFYFKNGKRQLVGHYIDKEMVGPVFIYHPNGTLHAELEYFHSKFNEKAGLETLDPVVKNAKDSAGVDMVTNGKGHYIQYDEYDPSIIVAEGDLLNGKWEGEVKGRDLKYRLSFVESYKNGALISGSAKDTLGNEYYYSAFFMPPAYKGGTDNFYKFVQKNLKYPGKARDKKAQGRVFMEFTILPDGSPVNFEIRRTPDPDLGIEAVRVLKAAGNWEPGRIRGKAVECVFNIPISFSLSN